MEALKPSEVLSRAADLVEPVGAWTWGYLARDANGQYVDPEHPGAVCWCAAGAMQRQTPVGSLAYIKALTLVRRRVIRTGLASFNDAPGRTQAEVVAALRKASDLAKADGQ